MSGAHSDGWRRVSVCVCTRNRAEDLSRCLASIGRSKLPVHEIIVSDDSDEGEPSFQTRRVAESTPRCLYVRGPRRGLCANRNNAISASSGSHLIFLDDDAMLASNFLDRAFAALNATPTAQRRQTIVTGRELRNGTRLTAARDQSFLGFQERSYRDGESMSTVVINATLFPVELFTKTGFDERLRYGYDEVDLTTRALRHGFAIIEQPEAVNDHNPSPLGRGDYEGMVDASRLYVTFKRYLVTDATPARAAAFAVIAPLHLAGSSLKRGGIPELRQAAAAVSGAVQHARSGLRLDPRPSLARSR